MATHIATSPFAISDGDAEGGPPASTASTDLGVANAYLVAVGADRSVYVVTQDVPRAIKRCAGPCTAAGQFVDIADDSFREIVADPLDLGVGADGYLYVSSFGKGVAVGAPN